MAVGGLQKSPEEYARPACMNGRDLKQLACLKIDDFIGMWISLIILKSWSDNICKILHCLCVIVTNCQKYKMLCCG